MLRFLEPFKPLFGIAIAAVIWSAFRSNGTLLQDYFPFIGGHVPKFMNQNQMLQDSTFIFAFLTAITLFFQKSWQLLLDKKSIFVGTYLSLPEDATELNVFRIEFRHLTGQYGLEGNAYSLARNEKIGAWWSEKLNMRTSRGVALSYIFDGERQGHDVRGHVDIKFEGNKAEKSTHGYWVDVEKISHELSHWQRTNYCKVTTQIRKKLIPEAIYRDNEFPYLHIRWFVKSPEAIYKAYYNRQTELARDPDFARPPKH